MRLYLDSSAIVKLVQRERESAALRRFLRRHRADDRVTSYLARIEVVRAVWPGGANAVDLARRQLGRLHQITIDASLLDRAAELAPGTRLRSLDAVHVASAGLLGSELRAVLTYDDRVSATAEGVGLPVASPS